MDYTYYLQAEDEETLNHIAAAVRTLREEAKVVAVRPHPIYSDCTQVQNLFHDCLIEDKANTDLCTSVLRTRHAVSLNSTVRYQAYIDHVTVVIDDVSSPAHFENMQEMQYHMLNMPHALLSECTAG